MSAHDHLKFLNHGEKVAASTSAVSSSTSLGGINIPTLQGSTEVKVHDKNRSQHQKHVEVVDYLKDLYYDTKVGVCYIHHTLIVFHNN
jgi:hypothetical protein